MGLQYLHQHFIESDFLKTMKIIKKIFIKINKQQQNAIIFVLLLLCLFFVMHLIFWCNSLTLYQELNLQKNNIDTIVYTSRFDDRRSVYNVALQNYNWNYQKNRSKEYFLGAELKDGYYHLNTMNRNQSVKVIKIIKNNNNCLNKIIDISKKIRLKKLKLADLNENRMDYLASIEFYSNGILVDYLFLTEDDFIELNNRYYYASLDINGLWSNECLKYF